jgi:hypothetical protein
MPSLLQPVYRKTLVMIIKLEACLLKDLLIKTPATDQISANFAIKKELPSIWLLPFQSDSQYVSHVLNVRLFIRLNNKFPSVSLVGRQTLVTLTDCI